MTFASMLSDLYRRLGYQATPASSVTTRLKALLNETQEQMLSDPSLSTLLYGSMAIDSLASRTRYGLSNIAQIRAMTETTNDTRLMPRDLSWYRAMDADPTANTGTPAVYVPLGIVAVQQVPVRTGTGLWAVSSSASDTVPTVSVDAVRVSGYPHTPTATALTGTSRVAIGTLIDYIDVTQFQLSAACVGDISLYDAATAGNLLAVIPRGQTASRYYGFLLWPTPKSAVTYTVDVQKEVVAMVLDNDEPLLPARFHWVLEAGARMKEYEQANDSRYQTAQTEFLRGSQDLRYAVTCPPGYVCIPGSARGAGGGSNLGPWYPSGRW